MLSGGRLLPNFRRQGKRHLDERPESRASRGAQSGVVRRRAPGVPFRRGGGDPRARRLDGDAKLLNRPRCSTATRERGPRRRGSRRAARAVRPCGVGEGAGERTRRLPRDRGDSRQRAGDGTAAQARPPQAHPAGPPALRMVRFGRHRTADSPTSWPRADEPADLGAAVHVTAHGEVPPAHIFRKLGISSRVELVMRSRPEQ